MPISLGAHNARLELPRSLLSVKGRRERGAFAFEGPTLLGEAVRAGAQVQSIYATSLAYEQTPMLREMEAGGTEVYVIEERAMRKISDVRTPTGIVAVAPLRLHAPAELFEQSGTMLGLADVSDPGNAGTLLRAAQAFGVKRVIIGASGVDPYHPKVVRAAMGALFRLRLAVACAPDVAAAARGWEVTGLSAAGAPVGGLRWGAKNLLLVGSERAGLGTWEPMCTRFAGIPMPGGAESLNAGIAGAIALYEAAKQATVS